MPDGRRRSREHWTDTMESGPPSTPAHVHRLPGSVRAALAGLTFAVFLLLVAVVLMAGLVVRADQYVKGRGEYRDAEAKRLEFMAEERARQSTCDLLDQLPATALLDQVRAKYECGPGRPASEFPPDVQAQLRESEPLGTAAPAQPTQPAPESEPDPEPQQPTGAMDVPPPLRIPAPAEREPEPPFGPPAAEPEPEPAPPAEPDAAPPLLNLEPVTDGLCDLLRICA